MQRCLGARVCTAAGTLAACASQAGVGTVARWQRRSHCPGHLGDLIAPEPECSASLGAGRRTSVPAQRVERVSSAFRARFLATGNPSRSLWTASARSRLPTSLAWSRRCSRARCPWRALATSPTSHATTPCSPTSSDRCAAADLQGWPRPGGEGRADLTAGRLSQPLSHCRPHSLQAQPHRLTS